MGDLGDQWGKAGQPGMLRKGQAGQEGAEKRKEEKGKLLGADPEVGYWAKPQASTPRLYLHHPLYHRQRDNPDHYHHRQLLIVLLALT